MLVSVIGRVRTCASFDNRFQVCRLNHSATMTACGLWRHEHRDQAEFSATTCSVVTPTIYVTCTLAGEPMLQHGQGH